MEIVHRVSVASSPLVTSELGSMGVQIEDNGYLVTFEVREGSKSWPDLRAWIARQDDPVDLVHTKFSSKEREQAEWLALVPDWHHGYPQPADDSFGYLAATYSLDEYCVSCGVGLRQQAPFQMKREPRWGRRNVMQLNWVFDEYFVTPKLFRDFLAPLGIESCPVLNRGGEELRTVVQLHVDSTVSLNVSADLPLERCGVCGLHKYLPHERGFFPPLVNHPEAAIVKTQEWFGSGTSAYKAVLISQELRLALLKGGALGASTVPVTPFVA